jgi:hypothetical protein
MGTKNNPSRYDCMKAAEPDEPYFVLLGRDRDAAALVREWAMKRSAEGESGDKVMEALSTAAAMEKFAMEYHSRPQASTLPASDE